MQQENEFDNGLVTVNGYSEPSSPPPTQTALVDSFQHQSILTEKENSSLNGDLSSASSLGSSKFDMEDTSELDELLQRQHLKNGGVMGLLERLPLFIKLFFMLIIALLGVVGLGIFLVTREAQIVAKSRDSRNIGKLAVGAGALIHELQRERSFSFVYLTSNGTKFVTELQEKIQQTDSMLASFLKTFSSDASDILDTRSKEYKTRFNLEIQFLSNMRARTYSFQASPDELFDYYGNCTGLLNNFVRSFTDQVQSASKLVASLNTLLVLKENAGLTRAYIAWAIDQGRFTTSNYRQFIISTANEAEKLEFLRSGGSAIVLKKFDELVTPVSPPVQSVIEYMDNNPEDTSKLITFDQWWSTATVRINALYSMTLFILSEIDQSARIDLSHSSVRIALVTFFCLLLIILSIVSAIVFSMAITGPWRRIIEIQETTIKKFVPKGFLRILKCYRLSDLTLGKYVERDLTIMHVDIVDFSKIDDRLTPQQSVTFINTYLAKIGPIIRKNSGYIDKFLGTKIMACFPTALAGLKTAIEIQEFIARSGFDSVTSHSATSIESIKYKVAIGIHTGKVIVAAIGEYERMEGSIQGEAVLVSSQLLKLCKAFKVRILASHETMKRLRTPSEFSYRPLGYVQIFKNSQPAPVSDEKQQLQKNERHSKIKLYELFDRTMDQSKIYSAKEVKEAIGHLSSHEYDQALLILDSVMAKNPDDYALNRVRDSCLLMLQMESERLKRMQVHEALRDQVIRDAFTQFCAEERSEENLRFWRACEEYRTIEPSDDIKRIITTKQVFNNYLTPKSKYRVNTSDESIKKVLDHIQQYDLNLIYPPNNLFEGLQVEMEILMDDTFRRFKTNSSLFRKAFKKTLPTPLIHLTVEDLFL